MVSSNPVLKITNITCVRKVAVHFGYGTYNWLSVYRDRPRTLNELKTAITAFIRKISQADLPKVFANKIERVQAYIDARGQHFQRL
jgi:hypothetical protein